MRTAKALDEGNGVNWSLDTCPGEPGKVIIKTEQDCDPILDANEFLRNSAYTGDLSFGRHLARVPNILWNRWCKKYPPIRIGKAHPDYEATLHKLLKQHPKCLVRGDEQLGAVR